MKFNHGMNSGPNVRLTSEDQSLSPDVARAYKKVLETKGVQQIKEESFRDLYGQGVDTDLRLLGETKAKFSRQNEGMKQAADVFEMVLCDQGQKHHWFGEGAEIIKASEFDDVINGVDGVLEFRRAKGFVSQLALAVDITFSSELDKKFDRIRGEIVSGKMAKVKYFHSKTTNIRGEKTQVPKAIIGADKLTVEGLARLWADGNERFLVNHPVQYQIIEELILQCEAFSRYAHRYNQKEVAEKYDQSLAILQDVFTAKRKSGGDIGDRDRAFQAIKRHARSL